MSADPFGGGDGQIDFAGFFIFTDFFAWEVRAKLIGQAQQYLGLSAALQLEQNFPNLFNSATRIPRLPTRPERVRLEVFDLGGRRTQRGDLRGALNWAQR